MGFRDWLDKMKGLATHASYQYSALPENVSREELGRRAQAWADRHRAAVKITVVAMLAIAGGWFFFGSGHTWATHRPCDSPERGFQCHADISHSWGQYSPIFSVPSEIPAEIPAGCRVTFAQVLSRHGARDPTTDKTETYADLVGRLHSDVTKYDRRVEFIRDYNYTLGADMLTGFGKQQLVNSGVNFYQRYGALARAESPFVRSAGQQRVVDSAEKWTEGFHRAREADESTEAPDAFPYDILAIPEGAGQNNTLNDKLCTAYEEGPDLGKEAQLEWVAVFAPPITQRLNAAMPGANLSDTDTVHLMDLCPFNVVASDDGALSPFCGLFTTDEWHGYDYYQTLGKWYGYTSGHPLAPSRGVGFVNELIARLTGRPVRDRTSTNATLDGSEATFPLGRALYADFSHDNDMGSIYAAMGLYNATAPTALPTTEKRSPRQTHGYSASWAVPFAARMYVEKLACGAGAGEGRRRRRWCAYS